MVLRVHYPKALSASVEQLRKLPGVGHKTAERFAFHLLNWKDESFSMFLDSFMRLRSEIEACSLCGTFGNRGDCFFCKEDFRNAKSLCIVAESKDVYAIEATRQYDGFYHVLSGLLSPIAGTGPENIRFDPLLKRLQEGSFEEIILALDATLEGDATALFLSEELKPYVKKITRIAFGIPMGSSFDYVDGGTLARAMQSRSLI